MHQSYLKLLNEALNFEVQVNCGAFHLTTINSLRLFAPFSLMSIFDNYFLLERFYTTPSFDYQKRNWTHFQ